MKTRYHLMGAASTVGIAGVVKSRNRCATPRKIIDQRWDDYVESVSATRSWGVIG
jgi:hypothetical protein